MAELLHRLGSFAARRAWTVIVAWLVILGIAVGGFLIGFKGLSSSFDIPGTASGEVIAELEDQLPDFSGASGTVVFHSTDGSALTDEQRAEITALAESAKDLPDVADVIDPFATQQQLTDQRQQVQDGQTQLADARTQAETGQEQLDAGVAQLDAAQAQLDAGRQQLEAAGLPTTEIDAQQAALDAQRAVVDEQQTQLTDGLATIDEEEAALVRGAALLALADEIRVVSEDGATAIVNVQFTEPRLELAASSKEAVIEHFESEPIDGVEVAFSTDISQGVPEILGVGEVVGVALAAVVLIVVLGSLLAASFPIITAIVGVAIGAMGTLAFSGVVQMASVTPILGVMLGLAVGIDYSLFILYRHRKQLLQGADVVESIGLANGTAGNAVVFAGTTVIVALLALNITGIPFLGLMGTAGAVSVGIAVLIAISLTPALLGLAKTRVLGRRARSRAAAAAELGSDTPRTRQRGVRADVERARGAHDARGDRRSAHRGDPRAVDAARPARRWVRGRRLFGVSCVHAHGGILRRGRERSAPGHGDASGRPRRQRGARPPVARSPKRSRPWTTSSRSLRSPCRTTTASRPSRSCPPRARTASRPRLWCATCGRCRRSPRESRSASPARPRSTSTSPRGSPTCCRSTCWSSSDCRC